MKKLIILGLMVFMLSGCREQTVFETVDDAYVQSVHVSAKQIVVELPQNAAVQVMENTDGEQVYLCDGYTVTLQTLPGGDMARTLKTVTGYAPDRLQPIRTQDGQFKKVQCVWSCAGEGGDQLGRCAVLDDGSFHYVVSVMADAFRAGQLQQVWQELFDSFTILGTGN